MFYYLLLGASEEERKEFKLLPPEDYFYLKQVSSCRAALSHPASEGCQPAAPRPRCFNRQNVLELKLGFSYKPPFLNLRIFFKALRLPGPF